MGCKCFGGLFTSKKLVSIATTDAQTAQASPETVTAVSPIRDVPEAQVPTAQRDCSLKYFLDVAGILKELTGVRGTVLEQLNLVASILASEFDAKFTSFSALSYSCSSYTVVAAAGQGAEDLKPCIPKSFVTCPADSISRVLSLGTSIQESTEDGTLALDWKGITKEEPAWFVAVPLWRDAQVVGTLSMGFAKKPEGFREQGWLTSLEILGTWCGQWVREGPVPWLCSFLEEVSQVKDVDAFVKTVGRGLVQLAEMQLHVRLQSRVALVRHSEEAALVFTEDDTGSRRTSDLRRLSTRRLSGEQRKVTSNSDSCCGSRRLPTASSCNHLDCMESQTPTSSSAFNALPISAQNSLLAASPSKRSFSEAKGPDDMQVLGHSLPLAHTLLADCLQENHGIWISDCTSFMQVSSNPSNDVFLSSSQQNVVSMVVAAVPSTATCQPLLAAYLTSPTALGATLLQALLRILEEALVVLAPMASSKLQGDIAEEWNLVQNEALDATRCHPSLARVSKSSRPTSPSRGDSESSIGAAAEVPNHNHNTTSRAPARRKVGKNQSFTIVNSGAGSRKMGPLIMGLQDKLRSYTSQQYQQFNRPEDLSGLELLEKIGAGGFGTVYHGVCSGLEVAVKLIMERGSDNQAWRDALELAVMSTLSHPNILQVLTFFTDVLVVPQTPKVPGRPGIGFSLASEAEEVSGGQKALLICMEYCDRGSLGEAIKANIFKERVSGGYGAMRANLMAILHTLLEVALALRHLHSLQLVHCDVKPANVLLKSSVTDPRGFTSKLSDFGLVKIVNDAEGEPLLAPKKLRFSGTVTHSPPEMLVPGGFVGFGADMFAFGIIMWELYTAAPLYLGMSGEEIRVKVVEAQLRPEFPPWASPEYQELAQRCWAHNPSDRPTSEELVQELKNMMTAYMREEGRERFRRHSSYMPHPPPQQNTRSSNPRLTRSLSDSSQFPLHIL